MAKQDGPIEDDLTLRKLKGDPGFHAVRCDGARGLAIRLWPTGAKTWLFRYKLYGKSRQMALGPYPAITLAAARQAARDAYSMVKSGVDPIAHEQAATEAAKADVARQITFAKYAERYMKDRAETFKTSKQAKLWEATIRDYAIPVIGKIRMNDISEQHIQKMLEPIYNEKRETARKVVQRVAAIIGAAMDEGARDRDKLNPARQDAHAHWKKKKDTQRKDAAGRRGSHPAVPVAKAAEWFAALRTKGGMGARAVEFLALTGVRSGEVRAAKWANVDLAKRIWTVPVEDSKMSLDPNRRPHLVPLSDEAVALLQALPKREGVPFVFPAARDGMLSDMTLSKVMRDLHADEVAAGREGWLDDKAGRPAVPHGLRSTFRTWAAARRAEIEFEVAEAVLAHAVGGTVSLAYQRGSYFEKRVPVMQSWANWLTGKADAPEQADPLAAALDVLRRAGLSADEIAERLLRADGGNVVPLRKGAA